MTRRFCGFCGFRDQGLSSLRGRRVLTGEPYDVGIDEPYDVGINEPYDVGINELAAFQSDLGRAGSESWSGSRSGDVP